MEINREMCQTVREIKAQRETEMEKGQERDEYREKAGDGSARS